MYHERVLPSFLPPTVLDDDGLMATAQHTIERLTTQVAQLRSQIKHLEVDLRTERTKTSTALLSRNDKGHRSLVEVTSPDDGGPLDREVLLHRNEALAAANRRLELQLAKRKQLCDVAARELKEAAAQREQDLEKIKFLIEAEEVLKTALQSARSLQHDADHARERVMRESTAEVERIRAATKDTIESLSQALTQSLQRQSSLEEALSAVVPPPLGPQL